MKRLFLFLLTNLAAVAMLTIAATVVCAFCGVAGVTTEMKMDIAVKEKRWGDITKAAAHWLQLVADLKKL